MVAIGWTAWCAVTNSNPWTGSNRSPVQTRPRLLTGSRVLRGAGGPHGGADPVRRVPPSSARRCARQRQGPLASPSSGSPAPRARTGGRKSNNSNGADDTPRPERWATLVRVISSAIDSMRHDATPVAGQHGVESLPLCQCVMAAIRGRRKPSVCSLGKQASGFGLDAQPRQIVHTLDRRKLFCFTMKDWLLRLDSNQQPSG
jgi:hypothetical protein